MVQSKIVVYHEVLKRNVTRNNNDSGTEQKQVLFLRSDHIFCPNKSLSLQILILVPDSKV